MGGNGGVSSIASMAAAWASIASGMIGDSVANGVVGRGVLL